METATYVIIKDKILIIEHFFSEILCDMLLAAVKASELEKVKILNKSDTYVDERYRRASGAKVQNDLVNLATSRFKDEIPVFEKMFSTDLHKVQEPSFLYYKKGDFFKIHSDTTDEKDSCTEVQQRKLSIVVFLNTQTKNFQSDSYRGGSLNFYKLGEDVNIDNLKFEIRGKKGMAVVFRSDILHEVSQITNGERFTVVSWVS